MLKSMWFNLLAAVVCCSTSLHATAQDSNSKVSDLTKIDFKKSERVLGVLLFDRFEMLDACGPIEVWGNLKGKVRVITVAASPGPINSIQGPQIVAEFGFEECPELDFILVPGGAGVLKTCKHEPTLEWLRQRSSKSSITMSVCNGASILASAGLLDGRPATTNKAYWTMATATGPKVDWVKHARWVDDKNFVTSSGVSAGIDMSLHVVARLFGDSTAEHVANEIEYEWHRDAAWDPFAELHGLSKKP